MVRPLIFSNFAYFYFKILLGNTKDFCLLKFSNSHNFFYNSSSGFLPVNPRAEVNILNLHYIMLIILTTLYFILLSIDCQMIYTTIDNRGACCYICFKALYFHNLSMLLTVLPQIGNTSERPFCR